MSVVDVFNRVLAERGESMVLARDGEGTTITLQAKRILIRENVESIGNTAEQQRFRVKIGTVELAASAWASKEPRRGDTLTVDSRVREVADVRPVSDSGAVAYYDIEVVG